MYRFLCHRGRPKGALPEKPPRERTKTMFSLNPSIRAGVAAALTIAWALLMSALTPYPFPHIFPYDIDSPVLALEVSLMAPPISMPCCASIRAGQSSRS